MIPYFDWDWQAIGLIAQALAIVIAAVIARASISDYFASKSKERLFQIADESYQTASSLAHRLRIIRESQTRSLALDHDLAVLGQTKKLTLFEQYVVEPLNALMPHAQKLSELGIAGELFIGADFELHCRRIATCYEAAASAAKNIQVRLVLAEEKARVEGGDVQAEITAALAAMADQVAILDGTSTNHSHGQSQIMSENLDSLKALAHKVVSGRQFRRAHPAPH